MKDVVEARWTGGKMEVELKQVHTTNSPVHKLSDRRHWAFGVCRLPKRGVPKHVLSLVLAR